MKTLEIIEHGYSSTFTESGKCKFVGFGVNTENLDDTFEIWYPLPVKSEIKVPKKLKPGHWKHFKGGEYEVVGVAFREKTQEKLVIYCSLYDSEKYPKGTLWARPIEMFLDKKEVKGKEVSRFVYMSK